MSDQNQIDADALCLDYFGSIQELMRRILDEETGALDKAADILTDQIAADRLVHVFGPGGHSNLAAQEVFFRAGGLMHISAILDEGTMLSNGALRSMAMERTPGYGRVVIANRGLDETDVLILVNSYGINSALIDSALEARERSCTIIGISSHGHALHTAADHPARHPSKKNLQDVVDLHVDTKVPIGDAVVSVPGIEEKIAAISTFANSFTLHCLVIRVVAKLKDRNIEPPIWRSGNAPGGDASNARFIGKFRHRVPTL